LAQAGSAFLTGGASSDVGHQFVQQHDQQGAFVLCERAGEDGRAFTTR
jgi:hypothetical protein